MRQACIFGGILGLITGIPALGLALSKTGLGFIGEKLQGLRGYNEDGSPRTQAEYEACYDNKYQLQNRLDNLYDFRKFSGKGFSQRNIDMLEAMGLQHQAQALQNCYRQSRNC